MGYPRHHLVPPGIPGTFHCFSRCVRRAFLCGEDPYSGRSFEHRKQWVEDRILLLAESFAVCVHAYAVMSNHLHVVVHLQPQSVNDWSPEEVATRWVRICGNGPPSDRELARKIDALLLNPEYIEKLRERLASLSWFMARLNEPIARRANREDECTGRFWEGRFESNALLDDPAVLAAMVYVDINPVRAGIGSDPAHSSHTSLRRRLNSRARDSAMTPVAGLATTAHPDLSLANYLALVQWTARMKAEKPGLIVDVPPSFTIAATGLSAESWCRQIGGLRTRYRRAVGSAAAMTQRAEKLGQRWLRGIRFSRTIYN